MTCETLEFFRGKPVLVQQLAQQAINVLDHLIEIQRVRVVTQLELGPLSEVLGHIRPRLHLAQHFTCKAQGTLPLIWHRHVQTPFVDQRGTSRTGRNPFVTQQEWLLQT